MKRVWLLGITYIIMLICVSFLFITLCSGLHKPVLAEDAQGADKAVTAFLRTGDILYIEEFTLAEQSHLEDVRALILIALYIIIATIIAILLFWFKMSYPEQQGVLLSPLLFLFYMTPMLAIGNFSKLFAQFHQILFPQGNYSFPYDSLLMQTYPEIFFAKMALVIIVFMLIFSSLKLLGWKYIRKKLFRNYK